MTNTLITKTHLADVNKKVKQTMKQYGCPTWRLAELAGCSETTMFRRLRHELPDEAQNELINLIKYL